MTPRMNFAMSCSNLSVISRGSRAWMVAAAIGLVSLFPAMPSLAASSDWALNEGGRMRLILLPKEADGTRHGALVIEPKQGWITYWKEPGDVGIPPAITPAPGAAYTVERVGFPVPKVLTNGDMTDVGYDHPVTLPITLKNAPDDTAVTLSAFVGVCQNICIPFQADLSVPPDEDGIANSVETALVRSAQAQVPPGPSPEFHVVDHQLGADQRELVVRLKMPADAVSPKAFVSGPSGHVFTHSVASRGADGETVLTLPIGKLPKKYKIAGKQWGILVVSGDRTMETTLAFD
ncbi:MULTISPECIES: protein-disulfide reductase DsbD domain-containing protein [Rhizobium]|nr:protein-disulfide reductase DsbD domain-containing protein [Rhizobium rosettiformans]